MNIFTKHPNSIGESYLQHLRTALGFVCIFMMLTFTSIIHALFPFTFISTGSDMIEKLFYKMKERKE